MAVVNPRDPWSQADDWPGDRQGDQPYGTPDAMPQRPYPDPPQPGSVAPYQPTAQYAYQPDHPPAYPLPYGPYAQPVVLLAPPTSGMAVASMVLSIVGLVLGCCSFGVPSIVAVILGHAALRETRTGEKAGHGMAVAGLTMGYLMAVPAVALSIWFIFAGGLAALGGGDPSPAPSPTF